MDCLKQFYFPKLCHRRPSDPDSYIVTLSEQQKESWQNLLLQKTVPRHLELALSFDSWIKDPEFCNPHELHDNLSAAYSKLTTIVAPYNTSRKNLSYKANKTTINRLMTIIVLCSILAGYVDARIGQRVNEKPNSVFTTTSETLLSKAVSTPVALSKESSMAGRV